MSQDMAKWITGGTQMGLEHMVMQRPLGCACTFVLFFETIRTSAMRVIHITVKTDETQRLRIKFVLYISRWPLIVNASSQLGSNIWRGTITVLKGTSSETGR